MTVERTVEEHLRKRVRETGGEIRKVVFPAHNGAPDRLVGWSGKGHWLVELKRPKSKGADEHQKREHERLKAIGFSVLLLFTREEVDTFVDWAAR
jgi:hypothetical protein